MSNRGLLPAAALALAAALAPAGAHADTSNCTVITVVPYAINAPGHYCLASNLTFGTTGTQAIKLNTSGVVLDCNGFAIDQAGTSNTAGVYFAARSDVVIRNCTFRNFHRGIYIQGGAARSRRVELTGNTIVGARFIGIQAELRNGLVNDNRVIDTTGTIGMRLMADGEGVLSVGGNTVRGVTGAGSTATGVILEGAGRATLTGNAISGIGTAGNATGYGVRVITAASVTPVPAIITGNQIYAPTAASNVALSKTATTAKSRCVDNTVLGTPNGTQWGASTACL